MTTFSQRKHATSYPLEVTTKPSSPSLEKQEINEVDNTVNIVLAFPEKVDECEYEVLCNSAQSSHGHFKYRQRFSFMTESQEFGCTVEASSFLGTVGSSPLIFVIGVSSIKDVSLVKYDINTTDLYYTRKAGKITKILIEYEAPIAGKFSKYFPVQSMPCPLGTIPVHGVYLDISLTPFYNDLRGVTFHHLEAFDPQILNISDTEYGYMDGKATATVRFQFVGLFNGIEVTSNPFLSVFNIVVDADTGDCEVTNLGFPYIVNNCSFVFVMPELTLEVLQTKYTLVFTITSSADSNQPLAASFEKTITFEFPTLVANYELVLAESSEDRIFRAEYFYPFKFGTKIVTWIEEGMDSVVTCRQEQPIAENKTFYSFTYNIGSYPLATYVLSAYLEHTLIEYNYGLDQKVFSEVMCLSHSGMFLTGNHQSVNNGTFTSRNGRFALQLDKMNTEGIFIFDNALGRIVQSYTKRLFVSLSFSGYILQGQTEKGRYIGLAEVVKPFSGSAFIGDTGQIQLYPSFSCPGSVDTTTKYGYPHIVGSCNSPEMGRTGVLYSGTYSVLPNKLIAYWTGDPEDCSTEILRQSPHAEAWAMSADRTQCIGIEPPDDTGNVTYHVVDTSLDPPMQICIFDSNCVGDFTIPESRMADAAHNVAQSAGTAETMYACSQIVKNNYPTAYMATMNNPFHPNFLGNPLRNCYAITERLLYGANIVMSDSLYNSCFVTGRNRVYDENTYGVFAYGIQYPESEDLTTGRGSETGVGLRVCFHNLQNKYGGGKGVNIDMAINRCLVATSRVVHATPINNASQYGAMIFDGPFFM